MLKDAAMAATLIVYEDLLCQCTTSPCSRKAQQMSQR